MGVVGSGSCGNSRPVSCAWPRNQAIAATPGLASRFADLQLAGRVAYAYVRRTYFNDYGREIALVAEHHDPNSGERRIVGVGRLSRSRVANEAEFALLVADEFQGRGLGTELLRRLVQIGRQELTSLIGQTSATVRVLMPPSTIAFSPTLTFREPISGR